MVQVSPPKGLQVILQLPAQGPTQGLGNVQNPRRSSRVTMKESRSSFDILDLLPKAQTVGQAPKGAFLPRGGSLCCSADGRVDQSRQRM